MDMSGFVSRLGQGLLLRSLAVLMVKVQATSPFLPIFILGNMRPLWFCIREWDRNRDSVSWPPVSITDFLMAQDIKDRGQYQQFQRARKKSLILSRLGKTKTHRDRVLMEICHHPTDRWDWTKGRKKSSWQNIQIPGRTYRKPRELSKGFWN